MSTSQSSSYADGIFAKRKKEALLGREKGVVMTC